MREKTAYEPCRCVAYPYPHRPGSGLCEWPNPPRYRSTQCPGVHAEERNVTRALLWGMPAALGTARFVWQEQRL